jgi:coenzyme F420-reducing hydrogenase gamma subunit
MTRHEIHARIDLTLLGLPPTPERISAITRHYEEKDADHVRYKKNRERAKAERELVAIAAEVLGDG